MGRASTVFAALSIALVVLFSSVLSSSSIKYAFTADPTTTPLPENIAHIDYNLPEVGGITPSSPVWEIIALRDKISLSTQQNPLAKSQIALNLANYRLSYAVQFINNSNDEEAVSTLVKAENYLQMSVDFLFESGLSNEDSLAQSRAIALASLKHREVLENYLVNAPEDARPIIVKTMDIPKVIFQQMNNLLISNNLESPQNPFDL